MGARRIDKPIRLYILTIFIVVAYGVMPFISVFPLTNEVWLFGLMNLPLNGSLYFLFGPDQDPSFLLVFVSLFLCLFSSASAIWAFMGSAAGRTSTLVLVTSDVLWWSSLVVIAMIESESSGQALRLGGELVIPPIWLGFIWWNFTRPDISAYYLQESNSSVT